MNKKTAKKIAVTLIKSGAGRLPDHRATLVGLGLRRIRQTVKLEANNPCIEGMIRKVSYLLHVEQCAE